MKIRHLSQLVWDSHICLTTVPDAPKHFTTAPMVLMYKLSDIPVTPMASRNAFLGSGSLLKLDLLSLHSTSSHTLVGAPSG